MTRMDFSCFNTGKKLMVIIISFSFKAGTCRMNFSFLIVNINFSRFFCEEFWHYKRA